MLVRALSSGGAISALSPQTLRLAKRFLLERQLPRFRGEGRTEHVVTLGAGEREPLGRVDLPRRREVALRPEYDLPVTCSPRETDDLVDQALPDPESAGRRLDIEEPELRNRLGLLHEEDRADDFSAPLSNPGAFAIWIKM